MDKKNYRRGVGMIIMNHEGRFWLGQRIGTDTWQFPQGGIDEGESPEDAILRETYEEVGLQSKHIEIIKENERWIEYDVPKEKIPKYFSLKNRNFKGQRQKWFLARFLGEDHEINLNLHNQIEFTDWTWASYWHPVAAGVVFKRDAYRKVLNDFLSSYNEILKTI